MKNLTFEECLENVMVVLSDRLYYDYQLKDILNAHDVPELVEKVHRIPMKNAAQFILECCVSSPQ